MLAAVSARTQKASRRAWIAARLAMADNHPQLENKGDDLPAVIVIASLEHSSRHQKHKTQSSGYSTKAFLFSAFILMTSVGQQSTHFPQPVHRSGSTLSIAIMHSSKTHITVTCIPGTEPYLLVWKSERISFFIRFCLIRLPLLRHRYF